MKKVYLAPQTEAIELLGENAIMAVSTGTTYISPVGGIGSGPGSGLGSDPDFAVAAADFAAA